DPAWGGCDCLEVALDSDVGSKAAVLKAARARHWAPRPRREEPVPEEKFAAAEVPAAERVPVPVSSPGPARFDRDIWPREPRVVKRSRKWFDPEPGILSETF